jgi:hypothetical protein
VAHFVLFAKSMATRKDSPQTSRAARMRNFANGRRPLLLAGLLALGASACGDDDADEAEANLDVWRRRGPASYTYVVNHVCFCAGVEPVRVVVEDEVATRAAGMDTGTPREDRRRTMTELFEEILQIIEREPDDFRAEYPSHGRSGASVLRAGAHAEPHVPRIPIRVAFEHDEHGLLGGEREHQRRAAEGRSVG